MSNKKKILKKILAKRTADFYIRDNVLFININGEILYLSSSDIKDIWFDQNEHTITIAHKRDKITLHLTSFEKYQTFLSDFLQFFPTDQFIIMKRQIIKRLISGIIIVSLLITYLYLNHFERLSGIVYFLLGITLFSIPITLIHIKSLNSSLNKID